MGKLDEIKESLQFNKESYLNNNHVLYILRQMEWLIEKVEQQNEFIKQLRDNAVRLENNFKAEARVQEYWYDEAQIYKKQAEYWETNYHAKESVALTLNEEVKQLKEQ